MAGPWTSRRAVINDASILIDLNKRGLLGALTSLPMRLWIPDLIWSSELLSISEETKAVLVSGFEVVELDGFQVRHAQDLMSADLRLSFADCSALALAVATPNCVLLCSDRLMRTTAQGLRVKVHGIFWLFDQLAEHRVVGRQQIHAALLAIQADPTTRLPRDVLSEYMSKYR